MIATAATTATRCGRQPGDRAAARRSKCGLRINNCARRFDPPQLPCEIGGALPPFLGHFGQTLRNDPVECSRDVWPIGFDRRRRVIEHRGHDAGGAVGVEGFSAREHLVQDGADREDVGSPVDTLSLELLGRHVLQSAENRPRGGRRLVRSALDEPGRRAQRCEAKVEQLHAMRGEHDVGWLEVAVHDTPPMCRGEGLGHLGSELERLHHRQRTALEAGGEGLALGELHDQEFDAGVLSDVVQRADVGMIQRGGGMGLALESLAAFWTRRHMSRQAFESDDAIQPRVSGSVDLAHATDAHEREDLVWTEASTRCEPGRSGLGRKRVQRLIQHLGIEPSRKLTGSVIRFEVGPDVLHADAFGVARLCQRVGPYAHIEVADAIEDGANTSPGVRVEPAPIASF